MAFLSNETAPNRCFLKFATLAKGLVWLAFSSVIAASIWPGLVLAKNRAPRKVLYAIGGGGETNDRINQFDASLPAVKGLAQKGWETTLHYDFDHVSSKPRAQQLKLSNLTDTRPLTEESINNTLVSLLGELNSPKSNLKKGDQIMVAVSTHGGLSPDGNHHISLSNDASMNLVPLIKDLIVAAKSKGVKVGLVFDSCFSGNAIEEIERVAPESDVCLISTSASNRIAYSANDPASTLLGSIQSSGNLEQGFLEYRTKASGLNTSAAQLPEISSRAGTHVRIELRNVTEYLLPSDSGVGPTNKLRCANPEYSLFPGLSFNKAELQSAAAKASLARYSDDQLQRVVDELQKHKIARDQADLALNQAQSFPGYDWPSCQNAANSASNHRHIEKLHSEFKEAIKSLQELQPENKRTSSALTASGFARDSNFDIAARDLSRFKDYFCDLIYDSGYLLDLPAAQARAAALKIAVRTSRSSGPSANAKPAPTGTPTPRQTASRNSPTPAPTPTPTPTPPDDREKLRAHLKVLDQMNALWKNAAIRKTLLTARENRKAAAEIMEEQARAQKKLSSPETILLERETWLQLYQNYKKKNPNEYDPCSDFKI